VSPDTWKQRLPMPQNWLRYIFILFFYFFIIYFFYTRPTDIRPADKSTLILVFFKCHAQISIVLGAFADFYTICDIFKKTGSSYFDLFILLFLAKLLEACLGYTSKISKLLLMHQHLQQEQSLKRPKVFGCAQIIPLQNHLTRLPTALPMRNVGRANVADPMRYLVRPQIRCVSH
jgi:hypothetical protein